jgi:hypothetical protein
MKVRGMPRTFRLIDIDRRTNIKGRLCVLCVPLCETKKITQTTGIDRRTTTNSLPLRPLRPSVRDKKDNANNRH